MPASRLAPAFALAALALAGAVQATSFEFRSDPFAGSTALITPGRQVVGGEPTIDPLDLTSDEFAFDPKFFAVPAKLSFFNGEAVDIPAGGAHVIVLRTLDGDGDPLNGNQLNAGLAANLIASAITSPGAGFFVYFNSGLDFPRLVYSTDLDSADADLKILARFPGLAGDAGRAAMADFTAANFGTVPEPMTWAMLVAGFGLIGSAARRSRPATAIA